jgi:hypothetical protein
MPAIIKDNGPKEPGCLCPDCPYKRKAAILEYELKEMRERYWARKRKKLDRETPPAAIPKKRGAPKGHEGWFREIPGKIDKWAHVLLKRCPQCQGKNLARCKESWDHVQEDIVLPQVQSTCFRHYYYWCQDCHKIVAPKHPPGELPKSYIGPIAKSLAVWLKYDIKISDEDLKRLFQTLFHLKIATASVPGFRNQLARHGVSIYEQIQGALRQSGYVHSDETGWKVRGQNRWLWHLSSRRLALVHIDPSRSLKVLKGLLGETFRGILIADFLGVYNKYKAKAIQRCLVHLLRELRKMLKVWGDDPFIKRYLESLKAWIGEAKTLAQERRLRTITPKQFVRRKKELFSRLSDFEITTAQKKPLVRISKRLIRHRQELLTFLDHPQVDSDNNHAERQIRPNVLMRKITFGNDSEKGAKNHAIFMSIIQTAKLNGRSPPEVLREMVFNRNKKPSLRMLGIGERNLRKRRGRARRGAPLR